MSKGMLGMLPLSATRGPRDTFEERLAGEDGEEWLDAFKRFLRRENPWPAAEEADVGRVVELKLAFPIWKTVRCGGKTAAEILVALEAGGSRVGDWAKDMMAQESFVITPEPTDFDLVLMTVGDFGFPDGATTRELCERVRELGGALCPADLAPHLCLAYGDQPRYEFLYAVMEPITDSDGDPSVFRVFRDDVGRWLDGGDANQDDSWCPGDTLVFVGPRVRHVVDCSASARCPNKGWKVAPKTEQIVSRVKGELTLIPEMLTLHLDPGQQDGKSIKGTELRTALAGQPVLTANVLDYLLDHTELIPESWKDVYVLFWGTVYRDLRGRLYIRFLYWFDGSWHWRYDWLEDGWGSDGPSAVLASDLVKSLAST